MATNSAIAMSHINGAYEEDDGDIQRTLSSNGSEFGDPQGKGAKPIWNVFRKQNIGPETGIFTHFGRNLMKAIKILTYVFLCFFVFVGVIAARGSLQILVTQLYNEIRQGNVIKDRTVTEDAISWLLILIIGIPDLLKAASCVFSFLFGDRTLPRTKCFQFILIQLKEVLHVVGLCGLVFRVMPFLGPVEMSAILAAIPGIPTIVQAIFIRNAYRSRSSIRVIITVLAAVVLLASIVVMCILNSERGSNSTEDLELIIWIIASCVLVSLRWIETYVTREKKDTEDRYKKGLASSENDGDAFNYLVSSGLRLLVSYVLLSQYFCRGIRGIETTFHLFRNIDHSNNGAVPPLLSNCTASNTTVCPTPYPYTVWLPWEILPSFLVHFFSSALVYHLAITACKLCMQRVCFTIPLVFASPVYVIATFVSIEAGLGWSRSMFEGNRPASSYGNSMYIALVIFFVAWVAQVWACRQTWHEPTERLCFLKKLFVVPHYCSPVIDLSLLHSRRRMRAVNMTTSQKAASTSKIYICATMWHENRVEMKQILSSLYRLDMDQFSRKKSKEDFKAIDPDYYEFEGHVPFDDAMTTKDNKRVPNDFVEQLIEVIDEAGSVVHGWDISLGPPERVITPYGGRLVWTFPGGNKLIVHLKDKDKIRHKKRWSQIMYMYYLIGYEMMEQNRSQFGNEFNFDDCQSIFDLFPETVRMSAENTYFLALDGDVDFEPEAIRLLVDRMKKDPKVGATCGRIKPGGSGPVVWYQRFEYAIGHWLQKSAEHVFGCVLCSPGCFSMFRAKALMDDNVMRMYATLPTEPRHYLQYDQGEDRWLCTLMLQQGYRIEYCAAAEALTFAPEDFKEFFNQRRRWLPSTMANIIDLLGSSSRTTRNNSNISYLYIVYQTVLLVSSILGPSTVLLAMESSLRTVFPVAPWVSYVLIYGPTLVFIFICLKFSKNTQLNTAMVLSALYAFLMMAVIVGIIVSIAGDGWYSPTAIFLYILIASFIIAGLFHPHEFTDLLYGVIYFICIPSGYLFLIIFAICNMNDVSWGTRETQTAVLENRTRSTKPKIKEAEDEFSEAAQDVLANIVKQVKAEKGGSNSCKDAFLSIFRWANNLVVLKSLSTMQTIFKNDPDESDPTTPAGHALGKGFSIYRKTTRIKLSGQKLDDTSWAKKSPRHVSDQEASFWDDLIQTYLYPLDHDEKKKKEVSTMLEDFRNRISFGFFFVNGLWVVIMTAMTQVKETVSVTVTLRDMYTFQFEPLGFVFLLIFAILLIMQMVGMIAHRYETLLHVLAATDLRSSTDDMLKVRKMIQEMASHGKLEEDNDDDERSSAGGMEVETTENPDDLEEIYEDFQSLHEKVNAKSRPKAKKRLDLDRNYRKTVKNMKRRQTMKKKTTSRVDWKGRGTNGDIEP